MSELINGYELEKRFYEWKDGFPANTRFNLLKDWETAFCVQTPNGREKQISHDQQDLSHHILEDKIREKARKASEHHDKDTRQGVFR